MVTSHSDGKGKERAADVLEVEDDEERQERIRECGSSLSCISALMFSANKMNCLRS